MTSIALSPLVSMPLFWALVAIAVVLAALWLWARDPGALWRVMALGLLCLALLNPAIVRENLEPVKSVVAVVTDRSASQTLGERGAMTDAVREEITKSLASKADIEPRFIDVPDAANDGGTELFAALNAALADVPRSRIAGAIMITDGVVHDIPTTKEKLDLPGPLHVLVTGRADERDRQVRFLTTPKFGIVGKSLSFRAIVEERGGTGGPVPLIIRQNGKEVRRLNAVPGTPFTADITIEHGGDNVVELEVAPLSGELTTQNNRAVLNVEGIRDRLRVLLVSGQPHPGERSWRNLLKSDANVELVHFTILRPAEKAGGTPINELSLIVFPTHDLFVNRLKDFDLVIFDRYSNQGYIPGYYFDNMARYLNDGGAILIAAGPEYTERSSLANTALASVLPARSEGRMLEQRFRPLVTKAGERHPVTRDLPGGNISPPDWGEWFRIISASAAPEKTLMSGPQNMPLLVLDDAGKGRIALLLSDQIWLWARGFENGGPYLDFQRRLVHWLMKEPSLEEEALRGQANGNTIRIERQSMENDPGPVTLEMPDGTKRDVVLKSDKPGLFTAEVKASQNGLHVLRSGNLTSFVSIGPANPREFIDVFSSTEHVRPIAESTGGSVRRIIGTDGEPNIPRIDTGFNSTQLSGSDWIGFPTTNAAISRGIILYPATIGFWALLALAGFLLLAWVMEGRRR